jgi:caa(3)-type oxidase subunit IV
MERSRSGPPAPHAPSGAHGAPGGHAVALAAEHHPSRARTYTLIFFVLLIVTALEVAVTYFPAIPQLPALLVLAVFKFLLIAGFYMHLKYDSRVFSAFFIIGLILAVGMLFSFLALFAAHHREPFVPTAPQEALSTPVAGATGAGTAATPAAAR